MRGTLPTLLTMFLLALPVVAGAQVYKWTDANGTQHFSDSPPPQGVKYKNIHTRADADQPRASSEDEKASSDKGTSSRPGERKDLSPRLQRFCAQLQSNIDLLKSKQAVQRMDSDGKTVAVDADSRAEQLKQQQQRYAAYCTPQSS